MSRLFLIAASGKEAREHLAQSFVNGVKLETLEVLDGVFPDLAEHAIDGRVCTWGANPGPSNVETWSRMAPGDVGLVYSQGAFPYCARVIAKAKSQDVAHSIWGSAEEKTWGLLYFLEMPRAIDASLDQVRGDLGYKGNWVPQGFSFLGSGAEERLREKYGGFEAFLEAISKTDADLAGVADSPEIEDAAEAIAPVTAKPASGQGRQMSAPARRAVELHAMAMANDHYSALGWEVDDVSARESFDLLCSKPGAVALRVEVKGTTGAGAEVLLTRNEVSNAKACFPHVALAVVSRILVDKSSNLPTCSGGDLSVVEPWAIGDGILAPFAYSYSVPIQKESF